MAELLGKHEEKIIFLHTCFDRIKVKHDAYKAKYENLSDSYHQKMDEN